eukprot:TRINITY_DN3048_c0_g1_i1.p1 TRINITY_DN3048_c0_g1~~TRINITY_DN3048_c0_g1_i1.p1  ORF type:complete len:497 (-),score=97.47 TRINITY_DN3048_c0_g1_i1:211-1566(-)
MGEGEVRPHAGHCTNWLVQHMGLTIIDSLDTMLIMGLTEQYKRGRDYLANNLDWGKLGNVQVFELNIRCLGGLLSAYYMTKDPVLYRLSVSLGELLLPVFDSPTGYPYPWFNFKTKKKTLSSWTGNSLILAHLGTLQLEFAYLSYLTGNITYIEKALHIFKKLSLSKPPGRLYPLLVDIYTGKWRTDTVGVGAYADSFYEYVVKYWLLTSKQNDLIGTWYFEMAEGILQYLGMWTNNETLFLGQASPSHYNPKMEHLACASGAMFALGSRHALDSFTQSKHMKAAKGIGKACHDMYNTPTGLHCEFLQLGHASGPFPAGLPNDEDTSNTFFHFSSENMLEYNMRPEAVETWFYLYRLTNDTIYQDWGWNYFQSIEKYTKAPYGYTGMKNCMSLPSKIIPDDIQHSYFLAETLKYLFLLFSPPDVVSLDKVIFNTEAHPFPIFPEPKFLFER